MLSARSNHVLIGCRRAISPSIQLKRNLSSKFTSPISSIHQPAAHSSRSQRTFAASAAAVIAAFVSYEVLIHDDLRLDAIPASIKNANIVSPTATLHSGISELGIFLWGSNRCENLQSIQSTTPLRIDVIDSYRNRVVAPDAELPAKKASILPTAPPTLQPVKKPRYLTALSGQSFRDLALHETYAVAVTSKGDLLQWGTGYSDESTVPTPTLKGQNIVQVALTPYKIYARTKSGNVLILPVSKYAQLDTREGTNPLPSISFFWKILGYSDPGVHYVMMDLTDSSTLSNKKVVDISAGRSHLLALTASGRALCAAVDRNANETGQLGGSKLLEAVSSAQDAEETEKIDDRDIKFDTTLKEVPALRKLTLRQIVAGDRHSMALTSEGRVLGWGNNSLGWVG
jgi:hypothetical protein